MTFCFAAVWVGPYDYTVCISVCVCNQSWALAVLFNFFNNKKLYFLHFFSKLI